MLAGLVCDCDTDFSLNAMMQKEQTAISFRTMFNFHRLDKLIPYFRFILPTESKVCITLPGTGLYSPETSSSSISHQTSKSYLECVWPDEAISFGLGEYKELIGTGLDKAGRKEIEGFGSFIRDEKFGIVELFECP